LSSVLADVLSQPGPRGLGTEWAFLTKPVLPLRRRMLRLPPDTVVELPVDQLGLAVLTDMVASETWNSYNYIREAQECGGLPQEAGPCPPPPPALGVLPRCFWRPVRFDRHVLSDRLARDLGARDAALRGDGLSRTRDRDGLGRARDGGDHRRCRSRRDHGRRWPGSRASRLARLRHLAAVVEDRLPLRGPVLAGEVMNDLVFTHVVERGDDVAVILVGVVPVDHT